MTDNSKEEIIAHVERITSSSVFASSPRLIQFLRFCVTTSLNGEADRLKESMIGVSVFGRDPDYNPRIDPIVRVHARRLRDKLEAFYETEGQDETIQVEIRKGGYVPRFERRQEGLVSLGSAGHSHSSIESSTPLETMQIGPNSIATHYKPSPVSSLSLVLSIVGFITLFEVFVLMRSHLLRVIHF